MVIIDSKGKPRDDTKTTADKYAKHCELDFSQCEGGDKIIDVNKRGKVKDVTDGNDYSLEEPRFSE